MYYLNFIINLHKYKYLNLEGYMTIYLGLRESCSKIQMNILQWLCVSYV